MFGLSSGAKRWVKFSGAICWGLHGVLRHEAREMRKFWGNAAAKRRLGRKMQGKLGIGGAKRRPKIFRGVLRAKKSGFSENVGIVPILYSFGLDTFNSRYIIKL